MIMQLSLNTRNLLNKLPISLHPRSRIIPLLALPTLRKSWRSVVGSTIENGRDIRQLRGDIEEKIRRFTIGRGGRWDEEIRTSQTWPLSTNTNEA
jgi:hypothetical protein